MIWAAFGNSGLGSLYFVKPNADMNALMFRKTSKEVNEDDLLFNLYIEMYELLFLEG